MALVTKVKNKSWLIRPENVQERSALLRTPARKWMQMLGVVEVQRSGANARALLDEEARSQINLPPELMEELVYLTAPARKARQFPTWFKFKNEPDPPLPHQIEALKELYPTDTPAALMEQGTCKTRVAIDLMTAHFYEQRIQFVIVICPATVKEAGWQAELERRSACPHEFIDIDSSFEAMRVKFKPDRLTWLVVGIEALSQGRTGAALYPITTRGLRYAVVADESHRLANHKAICTQTAKQLGEKAAVRMIMTGTEIKRAVEDVFSQFEFLDPNIIGCGDFISFRNRYCQMGGYKNKQVVGYNHLDELMGLISPHSFQCDKSVLNLPPKLYQQRIVEMTHEQKVVYAKMKGGRIESNSVQNTLTKALRLQQIASGYYNTDGWRVDPLSGERVEIPVETIEVVSPNQNPKLRELVNIAGGLSHPAIVWVSSEYELRIVLEALSRKGKILQLTGATPREHRRAIIEEFERGQTEFFVANPAAGGIGITLVAARTEVFFSNSTRYAERVQAEDRAHRKGQTGSVSIIDLIVRGTVERSTWRNLVNKIDVASYIKIALQQRKQSAIDAFYAGELDEAVLEDARKLTEEHPELTES